MLVEFGKANLLQKAKQQPDKVKEVLTKVKTDGLMPTVNAVFNKLGEPLALGYCNVGVVEEIGKGVSEFKIGDRVAVMKNGKIVQVGTPEEILSNPANEYIEDFIKDIDRSKIMQAKNVMFKPSPLLFNKDGLKVAIKEMETNGISSLFVVDKGRKLQGLITIDDTIAAIKEGKKLNDIIQQDYFTTDPETYVQDLLPIASETKFPIAVVGNSNKLEGIIVRASVLSGLV